MVIFMGIGANDIGGGDDSGGDSEMDGVGGGDGWLLNLMVGGCG